MTKGKIRMPAENVDGDIAITPIGVTSNIQKDPVDAEFDYKITDSTGEGSIYTKNGAFYLINNHLSKIREQIDDIKKKYGLQNEGGATFDNQNDVGYEKLNAILSQTAAVSFDKNLLLLLISQMDCEKLHMYFCETDEPESQPSIVLVGANDDGIDLNVKIKGKTNTQTNEKLGYYSFVKEVLKEAIKVGGGKNTITLSNGGQNECSVLAEKGGPRTYSEIMIYASEFPESEQDVVTSRAYSMSAILGQEHLDRLTQLGGDKRYISVSQNQSTFIGMVEDLNKSMDLIQKGNLATATAALPDFQKRLKLFSEWWNANGGVIPLGNGANKPDEWIIEYGRFLFERLGIAELSQSVIQKIMNSQLSKEVIKERMGLGSPGGSTNIVDDVNTGSGGNGHTNPS